MFAEGDPEPSTCLNIPLFLLRRVEGRLLREFEEFSVKVEDGQV